MVPNICLVHPCQIVWQNYQESLRCLFIEIFVNHKLKVFMKSVMAGKRSIKEVLVSVACKVLLKIKAQYTWHAAVICQWAWCPELAHKLFCLYKIKKIQCNGMTTSLEIEPVMNMSNSAEMTTVGGKGCKQFFWSSSNALWVETNTGYIWIACFLYLMRSHKMWLRSHNLWLRSHKLCLFRVWWGVLNMETQNLSGYWGEYRRVDTNCN